MFSVEIISTRERSMRITNRSPVYYYATVVLNGEKITDFEWADEERGEVLVTIVGEERDDRGVRRRRYERRAGKVQIIMS